jgi:hypothetical protein
MTHEHSLAAKKTGYLATSLFLDDSHDLIILIVNTIQQDLKSDNYLVVCAALTAVCKLINSETIPAVLNQVSLASWGLMEIALATIDCKLLYSAKVLQTHSMVSRVGLQLFAIPSCLNVCSYLESSGLGCRAFAPPKGAGPQKSSYGVAPLLPALSKYCFALDVQIQTGEFKHFVFPKHPLVDWCYSCCLAFYALGNL